MLARRLVLLGQPAILATGALACMPSEPTDTRHLEVVAVRADPPTTLPGQSVALTLLSSAEVEGTESDLEVAWLGGCHNPPGGEYFGCCPALATAVGAYHDPVRDTPQNELGLHPGVLGLGKTFHFTPPPEIVGAGRMMGVSLAFFAVCRGTLVPEPQVTQRVPFACLDAQGKRQGRDAFAVGFTTVPTLLGGGNQNPTLLGLLMDGVPLAGAGEEVLPSFPRCSGASHCDPVMTPVVDLASAEPNPLAAEPGAPIPFEVRGPGFTLRKEFTLEAQGWSIPLDFAVRIGPEYPDDHATLWVVLRDNRGGVIWEHWNFRLTDPA
jgi:hypothetical protein